MRVDPTVVSCGVMALSYLTSSPSLRAVATVIDGAFDEGCFYIFSDIVVDRPSSNGEKLAKLLVDAGFRVQESVVETNPNSLNSIRIWILILNQEERSRLMQHLPKKNKKAIPKYI